METECDQAVYLHKLLPLPQLYHMLCASPQPWPWFCRELAFTRPQPEKKGQLLWSTRAKYLVPDLESFRRELLAFGTEQLHLGTLVYDYLGSQGRLQCQWHEVVLDIDLPDAFTRYCGCEQAEDRKRACSQCWLHIEGAQLMLRHMLCHVLLVEERHLLWVFSGKKGIHCVCNDPRLCANDAEARKRLIALLSRDTTDELWQLARELPDDVARQIVILFEQRGIVHRRLLTVEAFRRHCLGLVRQYQPALYNTLLQAWAQTHDWCVLKPYTQLCLLIALTVFYPRIDSGPLEMSHKYKAPFSVHAGTQRLALPMKREALISDTLPTQALTLQTLVKHYRQTGQQCEQYAESVSVFESWLSQYSLI